MHTSDPGTQMLNKIKAMQTANVLFSLYRATSPSSSHVQLCSVFLFRFLSLKGHKISAGNTQQLFLLIDLA